MSSMARPPCYLGRHSSLQVLRRWRTVATSGIKYKPIWKLGPQPSPLAEPASLLVKSYHKACDKRASPQLATTPFALIQFCLADLAYEIT